MERVDAAEKEASEVLHSLLSVERVERQGHELDHQQQVCIFQNAQFPKKWIQFVPIKLLCSRAIFDTTLLISCQLQLGLVVLGYVRLY